MAVLEIEPSIVEDRGPMGFGGKGLPGENTTPEDRTAREPMVVKRTKSPIRPTISATVRPGAFSLPHNPDTDEGELPTAQQLDSTASLLERVAGGSTEAREALVRRFLPLLKRWAHGRLPQRARDLAETDDLVQISLLRALDRVGHFESHREGAFLAYLRTVLLNAVRDEIRRVDRRPLKEELPEQLPESAPSLLEQTLSRETLDTYERALARLPAEHQEAVILRVEFGYSYPEIASALGKPSSNAARMTVSRALAKLAESMDES